MMHHQIQETTSELGPISGEVAKADQARYVAGVDIGGTNLRIALADTAGSVIAKWSCSTTGIRDAASVVALIVDGVHHLLQGVSSPLSALQAIAAGAPGITNVDEGVVIATSYLMGWRNVPLRAVLEDALGVPAAIDNDVNLAALGESWTGAASNARSFVFLAIGTGIGAGIMLNHELLRGTNWSAGEIGYMLVPGIPATPKERSEPGALENIAGGQGIRAQWQTLWSAEKTHLPQDLTATQIFDHADEGDSLAQSVLQQTAGLLSLAIYNMSLVLDCPLFVFGGGVGLHPALCRETQASLERWDVRGCPRLERSVLGPDAQLMGALRLALDVAGVGRERTPTTARIPQRL